MAPHVTVHSLHVAVITGVTEVEPGKVEAVQLRDAMTHLAPEVKTVVITDGVLSPDALHALVAHGQTVATGVTGDDAVKRLADERVVESVDRRSVYAAVLPAVARRDVLDRALQAAPHGAVAIADLITEAGSLPALVDAHGHLIASSPT